MRPNQLQKLTLVVALALVGLVGGIGAGLHVSLGCCHHSHGHDWCHSHSHGGQDHCHHSCSHNHLAHEDTHAPRSDTQLSDPHSDCAICHILACFHSTDLPASEEVTIALVGERNLPSANFFVADSSQRLEPSRGPPAIII